MQQIALYLNILWRKWWLIALVTLFAFSVTLLLLYRETPMYQTSARFVVSPGPTLLASDDRGDLINSITALDRRSIPATYAEIMNSDWAEDTAAETLQLDSAELRSYSSKAVVLPDSSMVELTITGPDPIIAAALGNAIGEQSITYIQNIYQAYNINMLDPATPPNSPFSPEPVRDLSLTLIVGLIVGCGLAIFSELALEIIQGEGDSVVDNLQKIFTDESLNGGGLQPVSVNPDSSFKQSNSL